MNNWKEKLNSLHKEFEGGYAEDKIIELEYSLFEFEKQIRADAIEEVKSKMISFHTDAIFQYGADIIEARADAFDELKDWVEEQMKEQS